MRRQEAGTPINMSSIGSKIYTTLGAWHHAIKDALEGWSDCLRLELKPLGTDVVIVEPGFIGTEFGTVLADPLLQYSGQWPYRKVTQRVAQSVRYRYDDPKGFFPPTVVADNLLRVVQTDRPKTRYAVGKLAKPLIWLRTYLGDRFFDRPVMRQL